MLIYEGYPIINNNFNLIFFFPNQCDFNLELFLNDVLFQEHPVQQRKRSSSKFPFLVSKVCTENHTAYHRVTKITIYNASDGFFLLVLESS